MRICRCCYIGVFKTEKSSLIIQSFRLPALHSAIFKDFDEPCFVLEANANMTPTRQAEKENILAAAKENNFWGLKTNVQMRNILIWNDHQ